MTEAHESPFMTPEETAERYRVSPKFVRRMAQTGQWPSHKVGRLLRLNRDELDALIVARHDS